MSQSHQQNPTGRIAKKFAELNGQNKTALVTFITAGDPGPDYSVPACNSGRQPAGLGPRHDP